MMKTLMCNTRNAHPLQELDITLPNVLGRSLLCPISQSLGVAKVEGAGHGCVASPNRKVTGLALHTRLKPSKLCAHL